MTNLLRPSGWHPQVWTPLLQRPKPKARFAFSRGDVLRDTPYDPNLEYLLLCCFTRICGLLRTSTKTSPGARRASAAKE